MNKQEFLSGLRNGLSNLPEAEIEERLTFYSEIIDDRIEEGLSQEEAVCEIGDVDEVISQIVADIPLARLVKEKIMPNKRIKAWEIVLLVLGSPIWLSLLIAAMSVIISLYAVIWSVIIALWAVFITLIACAFGGIVSGMVLAINANGLSGVALIGAGIVCAGLSIFTFYGCKAATKGVLIITKNAVAAAKTRLVRKETA